MEPHLTLQAKLIPEVPLLILEGNKDLQFKAVKETTKDRWRCLQDGLLLSLLRPGDLEVGRTLSGSGRYSCFCNTTKISCVFSTLAVS